MFHHRADLTERIPRLFADLMAYHATYRRTADRSDCAAACKHGTANGSNTSADRGALIPRRHSAAGRHGEHQCQGDCIDQSSML